MIAAVSEHEVEKLRLYSDPACADLLKAAAAHFGLQPEQIMPGNGSDENLFFALRAFCDADHPLAYADITYGCYGVWCGLMHIPSHIIPLKEDFTLDPKDYYGLNQTIVLANPNAPTGIALPRAEIEGILKANPNNVVIVDEAYVDFGGESCVPLIDQYENLLVVQTFSKSRQLAGARLGLAMGNAKLIADLNRVKFSLNPYNINRLTLRPGRPRWKTPLILTGPAPPSWIPAHGQNSSWNSGALPCWTAAPTSCLQVPTGKTAEHSTKS